MNAPTELSNLSDIDRPAVTPPNVAKRAIREATNIRNVLLGKSEYVAVPQYNMSHIYRHERAEQVAIDLLSGMILGENGGRVALAALRFGLMMADDYDSRVTLKLALDAAIVDKAEVIALVDEEMGVPF